MLIAGCGSVNDKNQNESPSPHHEEDMDPELMRTYMRENLPREKLWVEEMIRKEEEKPVHEQSEVKLKEYRQRLGILKLCEGMQKAIDKYESRSFNISP